MTLKVHYLITLSALFLLGIIVAKPGNLKSIEEQQRSYMENRIQNLTQITFN